METKHIKISKKKYFSVAEPLRMKEGKQEEENREEERCEDRMRAAERRRIREGRGSAGLFKAGVFKDWFWGRMWP